MKSTKPLKIIHEIRFILRTKKPVEEIKSEILKKISKVKFERTVSTRYEITCNHNPVIVHFSYSNEPEIVLETSLYDLDNSALDVISQLLNEWSIALDAQILDDDYKPISVEEAKKRINLDKERNKPVEYTFEELLDKFKKGQKVDRLEADYFLGLHQFREQLKQYIREHSDDPDFQSILFLSARHKGNSTKNFLKELYQIFDTKEKKCSVLEGMGEYCRAHQTAVPEFKQYFIDDFAKHQDHLCSFLTNVSVCRVPGAEEILLSYKDHQDSEVRALVHSALDFLDQFKS